MIGISGPSCCRPGPLCIQSLPGQRVDDDEGIQASLYARGIPLLMLRFLGSRDEYIWNDVYCPLHSGVLF